MQIMSNVLRMQLSPRFSYRNHVVKSRDGKPRIDPQSEKYTHQKEKTPAKTPYAQIRLLFRSEPEPFAAGSLNACPSNLA